LRIRSIKTCYAVSFIKKLVRYTETTVRHAIKLDHWAFGDDPEHDTHPLLNKLSAEASLGPLECLLAQEENVEQADPGPHRSRASAYLRLLRHYENRMRELARHLLISLSYCYRRFNEALAMARHQLVLPQALPFADDAFMPQPWRPFKIQRKWVQTEFDLVYQVELW
jgi:AraC-like DNA-binding protein